MRFFYLFPFLFLLQNLNAQSDRENFQNEFSLHIFKNSGQPIKIDGYLDELAWQTAEVAKNFWLKWPKADEPANPKTEVRVTCDDKFLYVAAMVFDSGANIFQSLKRDAGYWSSDGFAVLLDPANKATNGYFFATTSAGVQTEGLLVAGDDNDDFFTWDNRWFVETKILANGWTAEFAIPLQILRFDENQKTWGLNFIRNDASNGFYHTWTHIPLQFNGTDLGYTGRLIWENPPHRTKGNINLSPYLNHSISKDYEENEPWKNKPGAGLDAKIGIGSAMNLDLTVNPDFSQIESDEQVINLTRFDVQLPEKRTFFLENADIFSQYGIPPIRPFFSRKIGLDDDGQSVPILFGARLTGNLDPKTRLGAMNMLTQKKGNFRGQNFSALSVRRNLFGRTNLSGYFLNRQAYLPDGFSKDDFGRNAGLDFQFSTEDGKWFGWSAWNQSFQPEKKKKSGWGNTGFGFSSKKFTGFFDVATIGENYRPEMGFEGRIENYDVKLDTTFRIGYNYFFTNMDFRFPQKNQNSRLNLFSINFENFSVFNPDGSLNEQNDGANFEFSFKNTSSLSAGLNYVWANVPVHFKFDDEEDLEKCPPLPPGIYSFVSAKMSFRTDERKKLGANFKVNSGQFYNGKQIGASAELSYRAQPWGNFRLKTEYNLLDFPEPFCDAVLFAVTPRLDIFFNKKLNWTTFLQLNNQADNFNINSRLQWRYRPMSDFFLVFTDNYVASSRVVKNRAIVAKVNFWW